MEFNQSRSHVASLVLTLVLGTIGTACDPPRQWGHLDRPVPTRIDPDLLALTSTVRAQVTRENPDYAVEQIGWSSTTWEYGHRQPLYRYASFYAGARRSTGCFARYYSVSEPSAGEDLWGDLGVVPDSDWFAIECPSLQGATPQIPATRSSGRENSSGGAQ